jgi:hypothetical protein
MEEPSFQRLLAGRGDNALVRYLALISSPGYHWGQAHSPLNLASGVAPETTFLGRLARFHDLTARWTQEPATPPWKLGARVTTAEVRRRDVAEALEFIRKERGSPLALALLCELTNRAGSRSDWQLDLARVWGEMSAGGKHYEATYEQARALFHAGRKDEARKLFLDLYERTFKAGALPIFDNDFYKALVEPGKPDDPWTTLLLRTSNRLIERKCRPDVVLLAHQARAMGDQAVFDNLLTVPLAGIDDDRDRLETYLAAAGVLMHHNQEARAEKLVGPLLERERFRQLPQLWRLASTLADRQGQPSVALDRLEQALDLEYRHLPEEIELQSWRRDYRRLLDHYTVQAPMLARTDKSQDLAQRTIRAADRWRAHDAEEGRTACDLAAQVLKRLGQEELAWEYLTSPLALQPEQAAKPADLAAQLNRTGDYALADRAFAAACRQQPGQGQLLWDQAMNQLQAGKKDQGRQVLRRLVESKEDWPQLKQRAKWALERD